MKVASVIVNLVRERIVNDDGIPCDGQAMRIVFYPEGGYHVEQFVKGPGWVLDEGGLTDDQCEDVLAVVGSAALGIAAKVS